MRPSSAVSFRLSWASAYYFLFPYFNYVPRVVGVASEHENRRSKTFGCNPITLFLTLAGRDASPKTRPPFGNQLPAN